MGLVLPVASALAALARRQEVNRDQAEPVEGESRAVPVQGLEAWAARAVVRGQTVDSGLLVALAVEAVLARIDWVEPGLGSLEETHWDPAEVSAAPQVEAAEVSVAPLALSVAIVVEAGSAMVD